MKRQLDRLKGKRLVTGDPNLMTKDEICINATLTGVEVKEIGTDGKIKDLAGGGSTSGLNLRYFAAQENTALGELLAMAFLLKIKYTDQNGIWIIPPILGLAEYSSSSSSLDSALEAVGLNTVAIALDLEKKMCIDGAWTSISDIFGGDFSYLLPFEITEEEFYNVNNSDDSEESTVKEGDLIYYTLNDSFNSIRNITDNITQIAVGRGESVSSGNVGNLNRFVDIQDVTINKGESYVSISIPNFIVVDMPAFVYKVGSDLKTAEDIIGNSSITRITKEEYDNIFNM